MILVSHNVFGLFVHHPSWSVEGGTRYRNTLTEDALSGLQEFFLQPFINDRSKYFNVGVINHVYIIVENTFTFSEQTKKKQWGAIRFMRDCKYIH